MPLFRASAYLNLRKGAPHQDLQNPLNAFMGSGKSGPRLMCSGPCSLFACLSSIVLSIKSAGKCCDQNTQSRSPSMWLTMLFSKQSKRMPAKSAWAQGSHEILKAIITPSLFLPLLKRVINSISESSWRPLCTGLRGHVDPASRALRFYLAEPLRLLAFSSDKREPHFWHPLLSDSTQGAWVTSWKLFAAFSKIGGNS